MRRLAVIGRLATAGNMGDFGSSRVYPPSHVTPLDGIRAAFPASEICLVDRDDPARAAEVAGRADAAIVIAGYDARDEGENISAEAMSRPELLALFPPLPPGTARPAPGPGETGMAAAGGYGGDRRSLTLGPADEEIIRAVAQANPRTVVCVAAAGAVLMEAWRHHVPAILMMWYAGMEGGHALADVLTGAHNPSGRLPFSIPAAAEHLPFFDRHATFITYDRMGPRHGDDRDQRHLPKAAQVRR